MWLMRLAYLLFAAGALTPIFGDILDRDLHRDRHTYFAFLAAGLCLPGLLMVSIGRRNRGGTRRDSGDGGAL
jgi:hypothetical protein